AEAVVGRALFLVAQRLVGLRHLLETLLGVGFLGDVGVVLARELAVSLLDFLVAGAALDAEDLVVVLVLHAPLYEGARPDFKLDRRSSVFAADPTSAARTGCPCRRPRTRRSQARASDRGRHAVPSRGAARGAGPECCVARG